MTGSGGGGSPGGPPRGSAATVAAQILAVAVLAFAFHADVLRYGFTGGDTLPLIETSRIESVEDLRRALTQPLMDETSFVEVGRFLRPVTRLSYALDYALWGLDPVGYNLTSVLLHVVASVLALLCIRSMTSGDALASVAAGALVAVSPVAVVVVRYTAQRQDTLATVFVLAALFLFSIRAGPARPRRWARWLSVLAFGLALGAKEVAVVGLPVLVALAWAERGGARPAPRLRAVASETWPHAAVLVGWLACRLALLGSVGGYLVWPGHGASELLDFAAAITFGYVVMLLVPWAAPMFEDHIDLAVAGGAALATVGLIAAIRLARLRPRLPDALRRAVAATSVGTLAPLAVYLAVRYFAERLMYLPAVFFAMLVAVAAAHALRRSLSALGRARSAPRAVASQDRWPGRLATGAAFLCVPLLVFGAASIRRDRRLEALGEAARSFFERAEAALEPLPPGSRLVLHNTSLDPDGEPQPADHLGSAPRSIERAFACWLRLRFPDRSFRVVLEDGGARRLEWGRPVAVGPTGGAGVVVLHVPGGGHDEPEPFARGRPVR